MDPNNQPWTPKPYQPENPEPQQSPQAPKPPVDPYAWQREATQQQQPSTEQDQQITSQMPAHYIAPSTTPPVAPVPQQQAPQSWPSTPMPPTHQTQAPLVPTQQYGGPMAELPPIAPPGQTITPEAKKQRKIFWIIIAALVILPALSIGAYFGIKMAQDSDQKKVIEQQEKLNYNTEALQSIAKAPLTEAGVSKLDKAATFYTVFKQAAVKPVVQTKWSVYYTGAENDPRADQYALYDTAIDYASKKYSYSENSYSNLGLYQIRCIGDKQYNYNDSKLTTSPSWQPASDSTDCKLNTVTMHLNDGMNAGGLTSDQADTFIRKIQRYGMVKVNNISLATNKDKQYIKLDVNVTPQKQGSIYWGMQLFMNAFQATGLNPEKQPYTFFGAGGEGAHIQYYIDATTQLPVYAKFDSTAALNNSGKAQLTTNWSHRAVEYAFPANVTDQNLDSATPITFTAWPDH